MPRPGASPQLMLRPIHQQPASATIPQAQEANGWQQRPGSVATPAHAVRTPQTPPPPFAGGGQQLAGGQSRDPPSCREMSEQLPQPPHRAQQLPHQFQQPSQPHQLYQVLCTAWPPNRRVIAQISHAQPGPSLPQPVPLSPQQQQQVQKEAAGLTCGSGAPSVGVDSDSTTALNLTAEPVEPISGRTSLSSLATAGATAASRVLPLVGGQVADRQAQHEHHERPVSEVVKLEQHLMQRDSQLQAAVLELSSQVASYHRQQTEMMMEMAAAVGTTRPRAPDSPMAGRPKPCGQPPSVRGASNSPPASPRSGQVERIASIASSYPQCSPPHSCKLEEGLGPIFLDMPDLKLQTFAADSLCAEERRRFIEEQEQLRQSLFDVQRDNQALQENYCQLQQEKARLEETLKGTLVRTATVEADNAELREFVGSLVTRIASLEGQLASRSTELTAAPAPARPPAVHLVSPRTGQLEAFAGGTMAAAARAAAPLPQVPAAKGRGRGVTGRVPSDRPLLGLR